MPAKICRGLPDCGERRSRTTARIANVAFVALVVTAFEVSRAQEPGSIAAERARLAQITGDTTQLDSSRAPALTAWLPALARIPHLKSLPATVMLPELRITHNSSLPYSLNDGPLWAGRGWNVSLSAGLAAGGEWRRTVIRAWLAPTLVYSENLPFQIFASTTPGRSAFANPFQGPDQSIDLPLRFGDLYLLQLDPGRSGFSVISHGVAIGARTDNDWWGPAIRNPLLMSDNAPGIPRFFLQSATPVRTRAGSISAKLISGTLTQSRFFSENEIENRHLSGVLVELRPSFDSTLTLGFARVVYSPIGRYASPFTLTLARSFDALFRWEAMTPFQRSDQIYSTMMRWFFPQSGFEVYGEWARMALPRNVADLLVAGHYTGGYTLGFQWAQPHRAHDYLRLQSELTYLEQSRVFPGKPTPDFYTGRGSPQGYTQRGQLIGAAIGPGGSSQYVALDYLARRWQIGIFAGRIRWENDALYRQTAATLWRHDVTLLSGVRGAWRAPLMDYSAELTVARRYNYLFQNGLANPGGYRTVDVPNLTLALVATPR